MSRSGDVTKNGDREVRESQPFPPVVYWDASAVLSVLFQDAHSHPAAIWAKRPGVHLLSSLGLAEVHAVVERIRRQRALAEILVNAALESLRSGPWRLILTRPRRDVVETLAKSWPLRGADLWHLALVKTLQPKLPETRLLTFDLRLGESATGEGLVCAWGVTEPPDT